MRKPKDKPPPTFGAIAGGLAVGFAGSLVLVIIAAFTWGMTRRTVPLVQALLTIIVFLVVAATLLRWLLFDVVQNPWARAVAILVVAPIWLLAGTCAATVHDF